MKWSRLFRPSTKQSKKQSTIIDESRQDDNENTNTTTPPPPKPKPQMMMGSLAHHHVSTNHLCGIKVSKCCNRALYDAAK
mmetsp:Transcript_25097/g.39432  ORF Transcript_25097/g.39432 Transcript_25097/m.39432 type:complete len:80 (+) Transcript_25097:172-411(+)